VNGGASLARARHLSAVKRFEEAIKAAGAAVSDQSTAPDALCLVAYCQLRLGDAKAASESAGQAIAAGANGEWPHRLLASALLRQGRPWRALPEAREAARIAPESPEALQVLSLVLIVARRREEALAVAERNVATNPDSEVAHCALGTVFNACGDWQYAKREFREALRIDPHNGEATIGMAHALRRQGRGAEAADTYLAAAQVDPTDARVHSGLHHVGVPAITGYVTVLGLMVLFPGQAYKLTHNTWTLLLLATIWAVAVAAAVAISVWSHRRATNQLPDHAQLGLQLARRNRSIAGLSIVGLGWTLLGILALADHWSVAGLGVTTVGCVLLVFPFLHRRRSRTVLARRVLRQ
jgi:tetratricopeptide (TPR) repeat protein